MEVVTFNTLNKIQREQAAQILTEEVPEGWPTFADAAEEIAELISGSDYMFLGAVENSEIIGWAGLLPQYGKVFELHPLVVRHDRQQRGIGSILLNEIMNAAREKGGLTLILGSGDEKPEGETSFANVDLYEDLPRKIAEYEPGTHATAFYLKHGFQVVGVTPDAYGIGKPDIHMSIRLYQTHIPAPGQDFFFPPRYNEPANRKILTPGKR